MPCGALLTKTTFDNFTLKAFVAIKVISESLQSYFRIRSGIFPTWFIPSRLHSKPKAALRRLKASKASCRWVVAICGIRSFMFFSWLSLMHVICCFWSCLCGSCAICKHMAGEPVASESFLAPNNIWPGKNKCFRCVLQSYIWNLSYMTYLSGVVLFVRCLLQSFRVTSDIFLTWLIWLARFVLWDVGFRVTSDFFLKWLTWVARFVLWDVCFWASELHLKLLLHDLLEWHGLFCEMSASEFSCELFLTKLNWVARFVLRDVCFRTSDLF